MPLPKRHLIAEVPRVQFYAGGPRPPEDDTFSACMRALLEHRGDDLGLGRPGMEEDEKWHEVHCFLVGMGGSGFKLAFDSTFDLYTTSLQAGVPSLRRAVTQAIEAAGYSAQVFIFKPHGEDKADSPSEAEVKKAVSASLLKGQPVIAAGIAGPPEFSIITGWDEDMDVLMGWSFFLDDPEFSMGMDKEPNGMFRITNWLKDLEILIILGSKTAARHPNAYRRGLGSGSQVLRSCSASGAMNGPAAYQAWCDALTDPDHWPSSSDVVLRQSHAYHWQTAGTLAEDRAWGAVFLNQAAEAFTEAAVELRAAHRCFMNIHDLVWAVWEFSGPFPSMESGAPRFADPGRRARVIPLIRLMAEQDEKAAELIEKALVKIGEPVPL